MKRITTIVAALLFMAVQMNGQSVPFLNINADPYSHSMGGATLTLGENAFTAVNNASAMALTQNKGYIGAAYNTWQPDFQNNSNIGFAGFVKLGQKFSLGLGGKIFGYESYNIANDKGGTSGTYTPKESAFEVAGAYTISENFAAGINVRMISSDLGKDASASSVAADISVTYMKDALKLAAAVTNIGGEMDYGYGGYKLPSMTKFGANYTLDLAPENTLAFNVEGDLVMEPSAFMAAVGAEYSYNNIINVRAGYHVGDEAVIPSYGSVGIGVKFAGLNLDAAYLFGGGENSTLNGSFGIALGYRF